MILLMTQDGRTVEVHLATCQANLGLRCDCQLTEQQLQEVSEFVAKYNPRIVGNNEQT